MPCEDKFISVESAANILGVHSNTIYRAIKAGEIPFIRIGNQYRIPANFHQDKLQRTRPTPKLTEAEQELFDESDEDYLKLAL